MAEEPHIEDEEYAEEALTKIVGYLDGELDDTQMNEVEQGLINDPDMRSHADILSRTWSMLDSLEEVSASKQFTEATLATISAQAADDEPVTSRSPLARVAEFLAKHKVIPFFVVGVVGALVGLQLTQSAFQRKQNTREARAYQLMNESFELLRNYDRYSVLPDVEHLRQLKLPETPEVSSAEDRE